MEIIEGPQSTDPLVVGNSTSMSCTAGAIPKPFITWFQIQNGEEVQLVHDVGGVSITDEQGIRQSESRSTLSLSLIGESNFTSYFCQGKNNFNTTNSDLAIVTPASEFTSNMKDL